MAAPKGNTFWKLRSKHGRDKIFATPDILWDAACEYFEACIKNPIIKVDWVGGMAKRINRPIERPFTITGLCIFLHVNTKYFNELKERASEDYAEVITRIEETIYSQKFSGAAAGIFNPNIIARDLGLVDKTDVTTKGDKVGQGIDYTKLSDGALEEIAKAGPREGEG